MLESGLYLVATPIGNLDDMSSRAKEVLGLVDIIAAEDTRHSGSLLAHLNIKTQSALVSLHEYNEKYKIDFFLKHLSQNKSIALISDAGTPLISDPGYHLVKAVRMAGFKIIPIPGPCALIAALSASGLPTDRFIFEGFLPAKTVAKQKMLEKLKAETRTLVFYESPHRIQDTLEVLGSLFGFQRQAVIARELTKKFETIHSGTLETLLKIVLANPYEKKGEFVLLVHGAEKSTANLIVSEENIPEDAKIMLGILLSELSVKQASSLAARITGINKRLLYDLALQQKSSSY